MKFFSKFYYLFFFVFIFEIESGKSQNLIPNADFELFDTCPNTADRLRNAIPWFNPTFGSPDYFNACWDTLPAAIVNVSVPGNYCGYQNAKSGYGYIGIFTYYLFSQTYREYIEVRLSDSLIAGQKYYLTFYFSLSDSSNYASDDLGVYFSADSIIRNDYSAFGFIPNIENPTGIFLTDKVSWTQFSGTYTATGGEKFLTIGNFKNDLNTDTIHLLNGGDPLNGDYNSSYLWIDDICLSADSFTCQTTGVNENGSSEIVSILPNPANELINVHSIKNFIQSIEIMDLLGRSLDLTEHLNVNFISISLSKYSSGIYFLKINTNGQFILKKIIITH
jgi:hypothetical protein